MNYLYQFPNYFDCDQACPNCQIIIEKNNGGCNHVKCYICKHEFCWMCRSDCKSHSVRCSLYEENPDLANESSQARAEELLKKYLHYFRRVARLRHFIATPNNNFLFYYVGESRQKFTTGGADLSTDPRSHSAQSQYWHRGYLHRLAMSIGCCCPAGAMPVYSEIYLSFRLLHGCWATQRIGKANDKLVF